MSRSRHLTRVYSLASLVGIAIVATVLVLFYRSQATTALMERESQSNSDIARTLANSLLPKYGDYIRAAGNPPVQALPLPRQLTQLREDILNRIQGLRIVKLKIYSLDGLVVYSTQASQIGDNKFTNAGFQQALHGKVVSEIAYRNQFSAFENEIYDRNLVSSYIPLRKNFDSPVEGVLEIYSDVTPLMLDIRDSSYRILFTVTGLMLLLYLFLLHIVRRASRLIRLHEMQQEQQQQERLHYLETHDELTGLYNRNGMLAVLHRAKERSLGADVSIGVMVIKLLRFKDINDSIGHEYGDALLRAAAERISASIPGGDVVCRSDGDEFSVVLDNLLSSKEADFVADKLQHIFAEPFRVAGRKIQLALAIGVDMAHSEVSSAEQLLKNAGTALGTAKSSPSKRYVVFDETMESLKQERFELEMDLGRAVRKREFVLFYQPKINARGGMVVGMEALLRWDHPERGLILPDHFIPLLEESGEIVNLGEWLLHEACRQCRQWHDEGETHLRVAVNVSLKQLHAEQFLQGVREALDSSGLPPQSLELELTESVLVEDKALTKRLLHELKRLGVMLSIDDFGTGYSSLSYLVHFPVDYIKIDRSFIRDMIVNRDHAILTNAIIAMAKSLKLGVIAEGVETIEQLEFVQDMGCDEVQGFYFSKAVAPQLFLQVTGELNRKPLHAPSPLTH